MKSSDPVFSIVIVIFFFFFFIVCSFGSNFKVAWVTLNIWAYCINPAKTDEEAI